MTGADLRSRILGCGDGPASFNASHTRRGGLVVSVDPLCRFTVDEIHRRIEETYAEVMEQTRMNAHEFSWTSIRTVEELGRLRMSAMETFLSDYPQGVAEGRYVEGGLPHLPFAEDLLISLSARICFSCTATDFPKIFMLSPSRNSVASRVRCGFFHCSTRLKNVTPSSGCCRPFECGRIYRDCVPRSLRVSAGRESNNENKRHRTGEWRHEAFRTFLNSRRMKGEYEESLRSRLRSS